VPEVKDCPMCGEAMRPDVRERLEHVPGVPQPRTTIVREWVCSECDYFEEMLDE
jgi:C4-type Zn-finger protein